MELETIRKLTVVEIRTELKNNKLAIYGTKQMLIDRLFNHLNNATDSSISIKKTKINKMQEEISWESQLKLTEIAKEQSEIALSYQQTYFPTDEKDQESQSEQADFESIFNYDEQIRIIEGLERQLTIYQQNVFK